MKDFDKQTFRNLKKLCRIDCTTEEEADIIQSLNRILQYVKQLEEVPTENVQPCHHVLNEIMERRWREDIPRDLLSRDQFLANAPDQIAGMIRIPPVLKSQ